MKKYIFFLLIISIISSCKKDPPDVFMQLLSVKIGTKQLNFTQFEQNDNCVVYEPIEIMFSTELDSANVVQNIQLLKDNSPVQTEISFENNHTKIIISIDNLLQTNSVYTLNLPNTFKGKNNEKFEGASIQFTTAKGILKVEEVLVDNQRVDITGAKVQNVALMPVIKINFNLPVNTQTITNSNIKVVDSKGVSVPYTQQLSNNKTLDITLTSQLTDLSKQSIFLTSSIEGANAETFESKSYVFYTKESDVPKFEVITDEALLTLVQRQTFKFFWDYAHPTSGLIRERTGSNDLVTIGGSGFGLMAILVGVERGFITRTQAVERLTKIADFLKTADRFHGVWSHWLSGTTGKIIPFSSNDNGGDLVETSFMAQGLLTVRQYLNSAEPTEAALIEKINYLLNTIEWSFYNHDNQNTLSWHWSPTVGWAMNMHIRGYNEALISYFMAATSKDYAIEPIVYQNGWAGTSYFRNGKQFYGITLPLGFDNGGPLFFAHYSFLGLDPRKLSDTYANYWEQNVNHTRINRAYCVANPRKYVGYSENCWGLTASDEPSGYGVHEPNRDNGVISPTAALSSFPYTPDESMKVMKFLYYKLGDRVWGEYGFKDAFSIESGWYADSYLAIDQGPIIVMIENHRSGLLWNLFMSAPEVKTAMDKLGFKYE